ncbi:MAG: endopeptidase La [Betaproteobacteria bacterium]|nr:endopeptidase La [Betaproteobacteria bacterium]
MNNLPVEPPVLVDAPDTASLAGAEAAARAHGRESKAVPEDAMIIVPSRNVVLFPGVVFPLTIGRPGSIAAAQEALRAERPVGVLLQRQPEVNTPGPENLHWVGTVANIMRYVTTEDGVHHMVCQGTQRFRVLQFVEGYPFLVARIAPVETPDVNGAEIEARMLNLKARAAEVFELLPQAPAELVAAIQSLNSANQLCDMVASFADVRVAEKQEILETFDLKERMDKVAKLLAGRLEILKLTRQISEQTQEALGEQQRKHVLREQMRTIQKELGEADDRTAEVEELEKLIGEAKMPEDVDKQARKELKRLERMPEGAGEYSMIRTYLDWLVELPWNTRSEGEIDIAEARRVLDEDHFGLDKIKRRILEFLAVRKLNPEGKSPILCFVGPPGVGKTSLGQSIAKATGRKFARVSLGGTHDEAEIRGHRRTYIGALPGNIIQAIRKAGTNDCVLMLDEMDKLGAGGFHGDPSSALLEVLDPEQNATFRDNYLGVPFDLSHVMFIGTANMLDTVPGPLRDRMEIIHLPGYTQEEKLQIARRYLVKRQMESNGLAPEQVTLSDETVRAIIYDYTREAGVRNLEREIGSVMRRAAMRIAEGVATRMDVGPNDLEEILGPRRFESEVALRTSMPGVATGLAWTPVGGDILFIEATRVPGSGKLILTGQLGEVMKESGQAALSLIKSRAQSLAVDASLFEKSDIHVHVPAGATPKDGPSAGVAMFLALASLMTGRPVRSDTAMTGEISLRGLVLPIGGVKEKVLAALRAGITRVMLPARNRKDLTDVPEDARSQIEFIWLETVDDAVHAALGEPAAGELSAADVR